MHQYYKQIPETKSHWPEKKKHFFFNDFLVCTVVIITSKEAVLLHMW